jgi:hypothetical protein
MPGYRVVGADEGAGLLPWSWAAELLARSRNYWVASVWPGGRPHLMPVWGIWSEASFWFSSSQQSRKVANLRANASCTVATEGAVDPVIVEGRSRFVTQPEQLRWFIDRVNKKYDTAYDVGFLDPNENATVVVDAAWAFALKGADFTGTPTRWRF